MTTGLSTAVLVLVSVSVSVSLAACGGAIRENASSREGDSGVSIDSGAPAADSATGDATRPSRSTGVVWVRAQASNFDRRACESSPNSDFEALGEYIHSQITHAGLALASVSGGGACAFGSSPTTLTETYVFTGTASAAQALDVSPPAPFRGTYITVPLVLKDILDVKFEFFIAGTDAHAFDGVWVHDGLNFTDENAFMSDICNKKETFDAAILASPAGAAVKAWLLNRDGSPYRLGYDATFYFDDGTTTKVTNANEATGGPYRAPCPNLVSP